MTHRIDRRRSLHAHDRDQRQHRHESAADLVGMDQVNRVIRELGMTNSVMNRRMLGRRIGTRAGENWVSAADLTTAVSAILDGTAASTDSCERMKTMLVRQDQNRRVTRYAPETQPLGLQAGYAGGRGQRRRLHRNRQGHGGRLRVHRQVRTSIPS